MNRNSLAGTHGADQHFPLFIMYNKRLHTYEPMGGENVFYKTYKAEIDRKLAEVNPVQAEMIRVNIAGEFFYAAAVRARNGDITYFLLPVKRFSSNHFEETLRTQQHRLFELIKAEELTEESITEMLKEICETIADLVDCDRVSVWSFEEGKKTLICHNQFIKAERRHSLCESLQAGKVPRYFEEIVTSRTLVIEDATNDERAAGLDPNVKALLDAPLLLSTGIGGVLCCESLSKRTWTEMVRTAVVTLTDMLSFLFERMKRAEVEKRMWELAYRDPLTGLPNQFSFMKDVNKTIEKLAPGQKYMMLYLKLDQFQNIQDVLGFNGGNEVLIRMARRIEECFLPLGNVARMGFDHFAIFYPVVNDDREVTGLITGLLDQLLEPMYIQGQDIYVTHSCGVAVFPKDGKDAKTCVQKAQVALNAGMKKNTRNVKALFTENMLQTMENDLLAEMNMRKGLDCNEFELYYQPQICCVTGNIIGFEALIRWNHPERGLIPPITFINLAESTGLIIPIGEWVIKEAFTLLEKWKMEGKEEYRLSINVSPRHFLHPGLNIYLADCLKQYDVNPESLTIEITENVAMEDFETVLSRIAALRELGFVISIDDFGTGFSAFLYLQHFPIQEIKIDRQFIRDIDSNSKSRSITKTIIDLADMLSLNVVCEGVETLEQWEILRSLNCPQLQGYYFSRPMALEELPKWVEGYEKIS